MNSSIQRLSRTLCWVLVYVLVTQIGATLTTAQGQPSSAPDQLAGWPLDLSWGAGFARDIIVTDINFDGKDEVILGINNEVYIIDETGANVGVWPRQAAHSWMNEVVMVAVGDIDGDGDKEVICKTEDDPNIHAWHFETGTYVNGWPVSSPASDLVLGDFDDDETDLEIGAACGSLQVYVLDGDGTILDGWPRSFSVPSFSQVYLSAGNIDGEGSDEIVAACHKLAYYQSPIYVLHGNGDLASGWPIVGNGPFVSPAVLCDLDSDGDLEVVAATVNGTHSGKIYAWDANGAAVNGWPTGYNAFYLSAGDLNSDSEPEIIAGYSNTDWFADHLAVIDRNGTELLSKTLEVRTAASLASADYDTDSEIIIPTWHHMLEVMDIDGQSVAGFPVELTGGIQASQSAIGDLDGDGDVEIVQLDYWAAQLHAFDLTAMKPIRPDWPMARHDERRSSSWTAPQMPGQDVLEISGPQIVLEGSSNQYTAHAYFADGSSREVTCEAQWWVDPCQTDCAHFEPNGLLAVHEVNVFENIAIHAQYVEGSYDQSASYDVRVRPTVQVLYVDDNAPNDPGPNDPNVSDPDEYGTEQHPFDMIGEAVGVAGDGDTVVVLPGDYSENVDFMGMDFTLMSTEPNDPMVVKATKLYPLVPSEPTIVASDGSILGLSIFGGTGIRFGENVRYTSYSPTIRNCQIEVLGAGIYAYVPYQHAAIRPTIENNIVCANTGVYMFVQANALGGVEGTIRNNVFTSSTEHEGVGIQYRSHQSKPVVINNIFSKLEYGIELSYDDILQERTARIGYNNLHDNVENYHVDSPPTPLDLTGVNGNISVDPCFADPCNGDYHLKSEAGRWDPSSESWVLDSETSLCIDAGNPGCPVGDEPDPNGNRINMGAFGGTGEASKSPDGWAFLGDLTNDWQVDANDLQLFGDYWLDAGQYIPADLDRNAAVNFHDFAILAGD